LSRELPDVVRAARDRLNQVLLGKSQVVDQVIACLLARGHLLLDDLPGLGKTTLAKSVCDLVGGRFSRVQCTPDLMPSDITGFSVFNQKTREFEFLPGPVFSDVLLADEINRATPRTQSALFEAMAERQVSIDGQSRRLADSFFVIATQNPVDHHGAFPLPEAQLDRFTMKLQIGYPDRAAEIEILEAHLPHNRPAGNESIVSLDRPSLSRLQEEVTHVRVARCVQEYIVDLSRQIRTRRDVRLPVSPRGMILWQRAAQAWAVLQERPFVTPDDVLEIAPAVLSVRITGEYDSIQSLLGDAKQQVAIPKL
jgi:MoxR-like ATPase